MVFGSSGEEHAGSRLATRTGRFIVMRAKIDGIDVSTRGRQTFRHMQVNRSEVSNGEEASGNAALIGDDDDKKSRTI